MGEEPEGRPGRFRPDLERPWGLGGTADKAWPVALSVLSTIGGAAVAVLGALTATATALVGAALLSLVLAGVAFEASRALVRKREEAHPEASVAAAQVWKNVMEQVSADNRPISGGNRAGGTSG